MPTTSIQSFFFNDTATTEIYTLSLHDALPILSFHFVEHVEDVLKIALLERGAAEQKTTERSGRESHPLPEPEPATQDRKSTRLNSSHGYISYAVFCLKKKKNHREQAPHSGLTP